MIGQLSQGERLYLGLAGLTAVFVLLLIILGAVVRVTDAESGCGGTWPLCDGRAWPPLHNELAWLDWAHRLSTVLTVLMISGAWYTARRFISHRKDVTRPLYIGLGLLAVQSVLGAGNVLIHAETTLPLIHLGFAVIVFSCLAASVTALLYEPGNFIHTDNKFATAVQAATLMIFMVLMTGALVVGSGSSTACGSWPLCSANSDSALIHLIHRGGVLLLGVILMTLVWQARTDRPLDVICITGTSLLLGLYAVQALLGALYVFSDFNDTFSVLHVTFAGLMWAAAVALNVVLFKREQNAGNT